MQVNTKRIGNIGEAAVAMKFVENNIPIFTSFGDNEAVDLIAQFDNKLNRIQVKTSEKSDGDTITFDILRSTTHRNKGRKSPYSKQDIDYFACYSMATKEIYILKVEDAPKTEVTFRLTPTKNNNTKNVRFASDYLFDKVIKAN